ncbi:MAG: ribonuclease R [Deltaproteobacteria bacterium]|nr:ribonuclease R [Deltaproteobacteria bacterium]
MARRRFTKKREEGRPGRKSLKNKKLHRISRPGDAEHSPLPARAGAALVDDILTFLYRHAGEVDLKEVVDSMVITRGQRKEIESLLDDLCHHRLVQKIAKKTYRLHRESFLEASLVVHPRGFAFATPAAGQDQIPAGKDLFIPGRELGSALHGDHVLLQITGSSRGRFEGRVVKVLTRVVKKIVGIYNEGSARGFVTPDDERYPFTIGIEHEFSGEAHNGDAVLVEITDFGQAGGQARGRIKEVIGDPDSALVQMQMVIRKLDLPHVFMGQSLLESDRFSDKVEMTADRTDLRDILHVTIDGETARDFDDAVSVLKTKTGFRLYVSIADVSHYVKPGSSLDQDAWERGTSVYFQTGVVPMLPERLSNNLCSLNPEVDRYAFTAILDFDRTGKRRKTSFVKSVIRSRYRLTYTLVRQLIVDNDPLLRKNYKPLLTPLKWMAELGVELEKRRMGRGSMGFEIPEPYVEFGPDDTIAAIKLRERNQAHKIIEEFMLAANEAVAETFAARHTASLYRVHQSPDILKVAEFAEFMQSMGYEVPRDKENLSSKWFNRLINQTKGTPREYLISNLILRVMQQARYSPENIGHFGLAAEFYTHFTSPIRRYPDLMVHRALKQLLWQEGKTLAPAANLDEAGDFLSKRERVAVDAEREMLDRLKVRYMENKIGENFSGIISGITSFGLFVELIQTMISGAVAMADLPKEGYEFHEKRHMLIGRQSGKNYQVGDLISVRLISVDKRARRINFALSEPEPEEQPLKPRRKG